MTNPEHEPLDRRFEEQMAGFTFANLDQRVRDGSRIVLDGEAGTVFRSVLFKGVETYARQIHPATTFELRSQLLTHRIVKLMQTAGLPVAVHDEVAVEGVGVYLPMQTDGHCEGEVLEPVETLYGRLWAGAYGAYAAIDEPTINAVANGSTESVDAHMKDGPLVMLTDAVLCRNESYGPITERHNAVYVPLGEQALQFFKVWQ